MADKNKEDAKISVFGLFREQQTLANAVDALRGAGFMPTDISALLPDTESTRTFAHEKHTKAPEGAATGATVGVLAGGALGLLLGIGVIVIPGLGAFLAAGPIMGALAGAGAGGAVGTLTGALIGMGIPEFEAKRYESYISNGGMLLSVHCVDRDAAHRARSILDGFGAFDISDKHEATVHRDREHRVSRRELRAKARPERRSIDEEIERRDMERLAAQRREARAELGAGDVERTDVEPRDISPRDIRDIERRDSERRDVRH